MTMPKNLVLVRHGESEGNVATKRSKRGDNRAYTPEFVRQHSSYWRLSERGVEQAHLAGKWLRTEVGGVFGRYYTSAYVRAMETAALLELPEAVWFVEPNFREREWGSLDVMTVEERQRRFSEVLAKKETDGLYWTPPNGESFAQLCTRLRMGIDTLHRECSEMDKVIIVAHGEVIRGFEVLLKRLTQEHFKVIQASRNPFDRIHNCQVVHYTRINPETGEESPYLDWVRSVCPTDLSLSRDVWEPIVRPRYTNEELLAEVNQTPRLLNN